MKAYKIEDVKQFMEMLFLKNAFNKFLVGNVEIKTLTSITIKGNMNHEWLDDNDSEIYKDSEYVPWKLLQPTVFSLIRGTKSPDILRINFMHYMENGDCGGLRIQFENNELLCISSFTNQTFSMDKGNEQMWDENCLSFLKKNNVVCYEI